MTFSHDHDSEHGEPPCPSTAAHATAMLHDVTYNGTNKLAEISCNDCSVSLNVKISAIRKNMTINTPHSIYRVRVGRKRRDNYIRERGREITWASRAHVMERTGM